MVFVLMHRSFCADLKDDASYIVSEVKTFYIEDFI